MKVVVFCFMLALLGYKFGAQAQVIHEPGPVEEAPCPVFTCRACPNGYIIDSDGCQTCACIPEFSCDNWDSYSAVQFGAMATAGIIGENSRKCRIFQGNPRTACNWYVKYDVDGNPTDDWVGLSFQGVPGVGGSGCCDSLNSCSSLAGAGAWLKSQHEDYCCVGCPELNCEPCPGGYVTDENGCPTCTCVFSCDHWEDYTVAQFAAFALSPDIIGEHGRECRIAPSSGTACDYYVKYRHLGVGFTWLGLTFGGTPSGTGCCASISDCRTLNGAASWLKTEHKNYCCGCPELNCEPCPGGYVTDENGCPTCTCVFSCDHWEDYTVAQFAAFALSPDIIGEHGRECRIAPSSGTACDYYVKYRHLGVGFTWLGLTFGGTPGGTGCCASVSDCQTLNGAASWMKAKYKNYCCVPKFHCKNWDSYSAADFGAMATAGIIGDNGRKCRITQGSDDTACHWYVKYDADGNPTDEWVGLSFLGVPGVGGSGCCDSLNSCSSLAGAGAWLKSKHKEYCCGPEFSCDRWDDYSVADFGAMATSGVIGKYGRKCRITQGSSETFCNWYVKYDADGDAYDNYVGLTWGGVAGLGGSGCCASASDCSTLTGAGAWLKFEHKPYCCVPEFDCDNWNSYSAADLGAIALAGVIGENGRKCRIVRNFCEEPSGCGYLVQYDIDGNANDNWMGLTPAGGPGGDGCCASPMACSTLNGAGAWLKAQHQDKCCGRRVGGLGQVLHSIQG